MNTSRKAKSSTSLRTIIPTDRFHDTETIELTDLTPNTTYIPPLPTQGTIANGFSRDTNGTLHWGRGQTIGVLEIKRLIWLKNCTECCSETSNDNGDNPSGNWQTATYADLIRMQVRLDPRVPAPAVGDHALGFRRRTDGRVEIGVGIVVRVDEDVAFYKVGGRESLEEWVLGRGSKERRISV